MKRYTFIGLIALIVVALALSIFVLIESSSQHSVKLTKLTKAQKLARVRMNLILAQRKKAGFTNFTDPCLGSSPPTMCAAPSGFAVSATIDTNWKGDKDYKVITVTVSGDGSSTLKALVANYD